MSLITINIVKDTVLKKSPVDSRQLSDCDKKNLKAGNSLKVKDYSVRNDLHLEIVQENGSIWYLYSPHIAIVENTLISKNQFSEIFFRANKAKIDKFFIPLDYAMKEFEINNIKRIAMFLAQIAHETGCLQWEEEIASGSAYEGRRDLGNIHPGDGKRYKGRGLIQLTGRHNYRTVGTNLSLPLETNPYIALKPENSARIAGYFWHSRGLNAIADRDSISAFKQVTRIINGGYNGLNDRIFWWDKAKKALRVR